MIYDKVKLSDYSIIDKKLKRVIKIRYITKYYYCGICIVTTKYWEE